MGFSGIGIDYALMLAWLVGLAALADKTFLSFFLSFFLLFYLL